MSKVVKVLGHVKLIDAPGQVLVLRNDHPDYQVGAVLLINNSERHVIEKRLINAKGEIELHTRRDLNSRKQRRLAAKRHGKMLKELRRKGYAR